MKRIIITIIALSTIVLTQAQELNFGIKGGFNAANTKHDNGFETDIRSGFHLGIYLEDRLTDVWSIQPELIYSQQGFTANNGLQESEQKLDYINLPIMVKAYIIPGLFIEAGPQIGYVIKDSEEFKNFISSGTVERKPKSFDYGLGFGAGLRLFNGLMVGARYTIGFAELYDDVNFNNRVFQAYVGIEL